MYVLCVEILLTIDNYISFLLIEVLKFINKVNLIGTKIASTVSINNELDRYIVNKLNYNWNAYKLIRYQLKSNFL